MHLLAYDHHVPLGLPTELDLPQVVQHSDLVALETLGLVQEGLHQLALLVVPFHRLLEELVEHLPE
ncbi:hypothetical protein D3C85_1886260 [compost metagenome]